MRNRVHLPEEIVLDILYRLPAKSLGRCKCVSKPWRTLISDPKFIQTHLSQSNRRPHRPLLVVDKESLFVVEFSGESPPAADDCVSPVRLNFQPAYEWHRACCSFNGLVLALNSCDELFVLNPTTQEFKKLPNLDVEDLSESLLGFGYDSTTDDYKVVVISYPNIVYVFSFKSDTWESVPDSPLDHGVAQSYNESGVFLNNSLHWFGENFSQISMFRISSWSSLLAFDLADEKFREVPLPSQFDRINMRCLSIPGVVDGCLCIVYQDDSGEVNGRVDVWVMKEYGVEESWTKISLYLDIAFVNPVHFWGNEEFVLVTGKAKVDIINVKEQSSIDVVIRGIQSVGGAIDVVHCTFVDTLISPKWLHQGTDSCLRRS